MEKSESHYCYEPTYMVVTKTESTKTITPSSNTTTTTTTTNTTTTPTCECFGSDKPSSTTSRARTLFAGIITNLGICLLLFGYTLIGSIIFLAIESGGGGGGGGSSDGSDGVGSVGNAPRRDASTILAATVRHDGNQTARAEEARLRTVENIWDITVSLNILYRDNWTRLAAQEITRFQDELIRNLQEDLRKEERRNERRMMNEKNRYVYEWTFAKAFLYSLTVLTTIGYGSIAPRTSLGKAVTMGYATFGIPLTLLYLSSIGSILSRVARGVFSRTLCCCLCSNCGYCCYDEKRMAEKERRTKRKRQRLEMQRQLSGQTNADQAPFYVRGYDLRPTDTDSLTDVDLSMEGLSLLAPILLCLTMMFVYICLGTFVLYRMENWPILDGFYFCFMSLTTIGFGETGGHNAMGHGPFVMNDGTVWFCSAYIMSGMALTAMCFNVVHDEIVHRLRHVSMGMGGHLGDGGVNVMEATKNNGAVT